MLDRLRTRKGVEAVLSPTGILAAAGAASIVLVAGLPVALAAGAGAAAWAARVAFGLPPAPRRPSIDLGALDDPWRGFVADIVAARTRFDEAVDSTPEGPLRRRLAEIGSRMDASLQESWAVARGGQSLAAARARIDTDTLARELAAARADDGDAHTVGETVAAYEAQLGTAARMDAVIADTQDRLRLIDARLDEAVTRAIELSVRPDDGEVAGLGTDVDDVVSELEHLRQALGTAG